MEHVVTTC